MNDPLIEHAVYLAGDSYPRDAGVEQIVRERFGGLARQWTGQQALLAHGGQDALVRSIDIRVDGLRRLLPDPERARAAVLFGRSSGAITATRFAIRQPVRAIVGLAYPFRKPNKPEQPRRYRHLATVTTPTLIFQGVHDAYGGRSVVDDYVLSPAVRVRFLQADHSMQLDAAGWDQVDRETRDFLRAVG